MNRSMEDARVVAVQADSRVMSILNASGDVELDRQFSFGIETAILSSTAIAVLSHHTLHNVQVHSYCQRRE